MDKQLHGFIARMNVRVAGKSYRAGQKFMADPEVVADLIGTALEPIEADKDDDKPAPAPAQTAAPVVPVNEPVPAEASEDKPKVTKAKRQ